LISIGLDLGMGMGMGMAGRPWNQGQYRLIKVYKMGYETDQESLPSQRAVEQCTSQKKHGTKDILEG
jgi:hypothetical protein